MTLVDKQWTTRGLHTYETQAILNTLAHYGVTTTEAELKARFETDDDEALAAAWAPLWQGKGKFADFADAAATELFVRLSPRGALAAKELELDLFTERFLEEGEPLTAAREQDLTTLISGIEQLGGPSADRSEGEHYRRAMVLAVELEQPTVARALAPFAKHDGAELTELLLAHVEDLDALAVAFTRFVGEAGQKPAARIEAAWHLFELELPVPATSLMDATLSAQRAGDVRLALKALPLVEDALAATAREYFCVECRDYHRLDANPHLDD
ncbi:MAG: hypothetical protein ACOZQL_07150 [Myxococcota bacterium]